MFLSYSTEEWLTLIFKLGENQFLMTFWAIWDIMFGNMGQQVWGIWE